MFRDVPITIDTSILVPTIDCDDVTIFYYVLWLNDKEDFDKFYMLY